MPVNLLSSFLPSYPNFYTLVYIYFTWFKPFFSWFFESLEFRLCFFLGGFVLPQIDDFYFVFTFIKIFRHCVFSVIYVPLFLLLLSVEEKSLFPPVLPCCINVTTFFFFLRQLDLMMYESLFYFRLSSSKADLLSILSISGRLDGILFVISFKKSDFPLLWFTFFKSRVLLYFVCSLPFTHLNMYL